ncbi:MAG TPA: class I SAM-dependent methyltransferase [Candidatus Sulfotelmatobacter sp.]|nr:class I SAM-dependent methyltransferase [Candidatus Sulfotelmatobacter sp.]
MTSKVEPQGNWGTDSRLAASQRWKEKSAAMGQPATNAFVDYAEPGPGMQILDLASGTGEPAITLARRIGPEGRVTATDLSADLLEVTATRAQANGLSNIVTRRADAHELPFPDNSFDLATSRFGIMFFSDAERALRELRRVLRPGARACFLVWDSVDQAYFRSMFGVVHRAIGGPYLLADGPNPFRFAEPDSLSSVMRSAGFRDAVEEKRLVPWVWPGSVEELWERERAIAVAFRPLLDRVPSDRWPRIHANVHQELSKYSDGENVAFQISVILVSGRK